LLKVRGGLVFRPEKKTGPGPAIERDSCVNKLPLPKKKHDHLSPRDQGIRKRGQKRLKNWANDARGRPGGMVIHQEKKKKKRNHKKKKKTTSQGKEKNGGVQEPGLTRCSGGPHLWGGGWNKKPKKPRPKEVPKNAKRT